MLIYEKVVNGERHLFGTHERIPSESDLQLSYKDNAGDEIIDIKTFKFFYDKSQVIYGNKSTNQIPAEDDAKINVWLGDELIIGKVDTATITSNTITNTTTVVPEEAPIGATVEISITANEGYEFDGAPTATANGKAVVLTLDKGVYGGEFVVEKDTEIKFTATVQPTE